MSSLRRMDVQGGFCGSVANLGGSIPSTRAATLSTLANGNLFRDSHSVDYDRTIHSAVFGLHYQRWRWGLHLNLASSSKVVGRAPDSKDRFGSLMVEFRH